MQPQLRVRLNDDDADNHDDLYDDDHHDDDHHDDDYDNNDRSTG